MGRPKGSRNKRTMLREAEETLGRTRDPNEIVDMLHVIERAASHFYLRAVMGKNGGRDDSQIDTDYQRAAHLAALAAPYRHPRLSAMKLDGGANNPNDSWAGATADELRAEINRRLTVLQEAGIIELQVIGAPEVQ
jgi:hypothetical protein